MTVEEKIVYLADAIEPGRDYPGMDLLRLTAEISLDQALLLSVTQTISFVLEAGRPIHPLSVEMRNSLIQSPEK
jgi:HD superfamily phosphohydrolase YqeK